MKRLIANTKFTSTDDLIYVGPVSDGETWVNPGYEHRIDSYSDEFKEAVTEIINKMKKARNKKGLNLTGWTNKAEDEIKYLLNPHSPYMFPDVVLEYADIFDGKYYIDYTDLYRILETPGIGVDDNVVNNSMKLIKSSPYYISEDMDGQLNLISNQVILDMLNPDVHIYYVHHNIEFNDWVNQTRFIFYPVDKSSAETMLKVINNMAWSQDITDYILSQAGILWEE